MLLNPVALRVNMHKEDSFIEIDKHEILWI